MAPLVRRTWSPCGATPVLHQRTRRHQKVSAIAAVCILPERDRLALYFRLYPDANINAERVIDFLHHLQRHLHTPIVLICDRLKAHFGDLFNELVPSGSAHLEYLPPYAPELNPVEYLWAYTKNNPLANDPAFDLEALATRARNAVRSVQHQPRLLVAFLRHTGLSLRLK